MKLKNVIAGLAGLLVFLSLDQLTKYLAVAFLKKQEAFPIIKNVFELEYLENHGAAFGVLQNRRILVLLVTVCILAVLAVLYMRIPENKRFFPLRFLAILLMAGAVGNLLDRMLYGYVIDFFSFKLINFPIFNVADCYVVIAVILAFYFICFFYDDKELQFLSKKEK